VQEEKSAASSLHAYVLGDLFAEKVNVAPVAFVGSLGPDAIVTTGFVVSTVQLQVAALLALPAASTAATEKTCPPSVRDG
jgi:hypothetical protein